ncbi:hypothetical protein VNI00_005400 [Paramarasmius palmivorus]|uniref:N-acetyltransferase domain-containing protein n=1 Tax=Paramarasmius palmivorus TaxID=297713 RepID=A0AAW0DHP3_9AGAR
MSTPNARLGGPYVRVAEPRDYPEAIRVLTRAFSRDPSMNWFGGVKQMVPAYKDQHNYDTHTGYTKRTLRNLHTFQSILVRSAILQGGFLTLAIVPDGDSERIAGVTIWLKPGQSWDFPLSVSLRAGGLKVLRGWGLNGLKRLTLEFTPTVNRSLDKSFKLRSLDRLDSWHLLSTVVDPAHEGKGLCSLMVKDGFTRASRTGKPIHLEATTPRSRDIYAHFGFEIDEEHRFGKGSVDNNGIAAKGEAATGYPEWVMTKWNYS